MRRSIPDKERKLESVNERDKMARRMKCGQKDEMWITRVTKVRNVTSV